MAKVLFIIKKVHEYYTDKGLLYIINRTSSEIKKRIYSGSFFMNKEYFHDDIVHIAFLPSGGLGDYIISRAILEEVLYKIKSEYRVTLYCEKKHFGKAIYGDVADDIRGLNEYRCEKHRYDLALFVEHFVHPDCIKKARLRKLAPNVLKKCLWIKNNWKNLYVDLDTQCFRERVQFERCRLLGLDRWTELRMGGAFEIEKKKVSIPLVVEYEKYWIKKFAGKKYITINYGADAMIKGLSQLKMWTVPNYEQLIEIIKRKYPDIEVVQLGDKDAIAIDGVDCTFFGESIEYVKYILKNSMMHIDCEGGLVHLATQLGTKCVVLFGPTPVHMYGYEQNVNIVSPICNNCMGLHDMWAYDCYRNYDSARCMESITPEMVMKAIEKEITGL